jgi:uncharacterized spore protein YtfJ
MTDDTRSFTPDLRRLTDAADDSFSVRRAYGEPYEHRGHLVIPVAKVWGGIGTGAGGGAGTGAGHGSGQGTGTGTGSGASDASGDAQGEIRGETHGEGAGEGGGGGGGYGLQVKPLGVYVVSPEGARWQPVLDLNKVILGGQAVGIAIALAAGWAIGRRRR